MPRFASSKIKRLVSLTATVALVIQTIVPGGLFSWPANFALAAQDWDFATASDYTLGDYASIIDGYAIADMQFSGSSDAMDGIYGKVTDVIETSTAGRILAAVDTLDANPYSTNYGHTWTIPVDSTPDLSNKHYKFSKWTNGTHSGRVVAGGASYASDVTGDGAIWYTTDAGDHWSATVTLPDTTKVTAIETFGDVVMVGTTGDDTNDDRVFVDRDQGGAGPWITIDTLTWNATGINDFALDKDVKTAMVGISTSSLAGGAVPIMYSTDGLTWRAAATISGNSSISAVLAMATDPVTGNIYATTNGNYVLKSTNDGATWSEIAVSGSANAKIIYVDANGGITIINTATIIRCLDGGTDFAEQTTDVPDSISASEGIIRMSDHAYLIGTEVGGKGDVYIGSSTGTFVIASDMVSVTNKTGVAFTSITGVTDSYPTTSEGSNIDYRFRAVNSGSWYYWDGSDWAVSSGQAGANQLSEISQANWSTFLSSLGLTSGTFYFQAFLARPNTTTYGSGMDSIVLDKV
ncbi:MAG: hypothetical protein WC400_02625, partial [Patescibacteria group bacterium]